MEKYCLSLKNIYRLLVEEDYPDYSASLFSRSAKKGLTVKKFWEQVYCEELRDGKVGKMIFRNEGSYNRLFSEFLNHSNDFNYSDSFSKELKMRIHEDSMKTLTNNFASIFQNKKVDNNLFYKKLTMFIDVLVENEPRLDDKTIIFLNSLIMNNDQYKQDVLYMGYCVALLTLLCDVSVDMINKPEYQFDLLFVEKKSSQSRKIVSNMRTIAPFTSRHLFFGRQKEMMDFKDIISTKGKCFLSGPLGCGKTEFLHVIAEIYSIVRKNDSILFLTCQLPIDMSQYNLDEFDLIIIDDYREDKLDINLLLNLDCCVILASEKAQIEGFSTYYMNDFSIEDKKLIFEITIHIL